MVVLMVQSFKNNYMTGGNYVQVITYDKGNIRKCVMMFEVV
jgi:hypothetical protein